MCFRKQSTDSDIFTEQDPRKYGHACDFFRKRAKRGKKCLKRAKYLKI